MTSLLVPCGTPGGTMSGMFYNHIETQAEACYNCHKSFKPLLFQHAICPITNIMVLKPDLYENGAEIIRCNQNRRTIILTQVIEIQCAWVLRRDPGIQALS